MKILHPHGEVSAEDLEEILDLGTSSKDHQYSCIAAGKPTAAGIFASNRTAGELPSSSATGGARRGAGS